MSVTRSTIPELYEQWLAAAGALNEASGDEVTSSPLFKAYRAVEDELIATPSATLRDLAIKIVVLDEAGAMIDSTELLAEARRLVGEVAA